MSTQKEIERFFRTHNNPPVIGVSDAAGLLAVDETVVRRWCRDSDVHRVGPNFVLSIEDVAELAAALDDQDLDEEDDLDEDESDDEDNTEQDEGEDDDETEGGDEDDEDDD